MKEEEMLVLKLFSSEEKSSEGNNHKDEGSHDAGSSRLAGSSRSARSSRLARNRRLARSAEILRSSEVPDVLAEIVDEHLGGDLVQIVLPEVEPLTIKDVMVHLLVNKNGSARGVSEVEALLISSGYEMDVIDLGAVDLLLAHIIEVGVGITIDLPLLARVHALGFVLLLKTHDLALSISVLHSLLEQLSGIIPESEILINEVALLILHTILIANSFDTQLIVISRILNVVQTIVNRMECTFFSDDTSAKKSKNYFLVIKLQDRVCTFFVMMMSKN